MKTVRIYGASDDLIEADGVEGADEFNPTSHGDGPYKATLAIEASPFALHIHALYGPEAVWSFAPSTADDGVPLPPWPIRIGPSEDCGYSTQIEVDVPDHATMRQLYRKEEG